MKLRIKMRLRDKYHLNVLWNYCSLYLYYSRFVVVKFISFISMDFILLIFYTFLHACGFFFSQGFRWMLFSNWIEICLWKVDFTFEIWSQKNWNWNLNCFPLLWNLWFFIFLKSAQGIIPAKLSKCFFFKW